MNGGPIRNFVVACLVLAASVGEHTSSANSLFDDPSGDPFALLAAKGIDTSEAGLISAFLDHNQAVDIRNASALAIALSGSPESVSVLLIGLEVPNPDVRAGVMNALIFLRSEATVPRIITAVKFDGSAAVRQLSIVALQFIGGQSAIDALDEIARDPAQHGAMRVSAVQALGVTASPASRATFQALLNDNNAEIRARSAIILSAEYRDDQISNLVESALDPEVPGSVWRDIVVELERQSGQNFRNDAGDHLPASAKLRDSVNSKIVMWWSLRENQ